MKPEMPSELKALMDIKAEIHIKHISWKGGAMKFPPRTIALVSYTQGFNDAFALLNEDFEKLKQILISYQSK